MFRPFSVSFVTTIALLTMACSADPESRAQERFERAEAYAKQGKYSEAVVEYQSAIQAQPRFGLAYLKLGEAYEKQKSGVQALNAYVRAADLLPDNEEAQIRAVNYLITARRFEDARDRATAVVVRNPKSVEAQLLVGYASAGLKEFDRAIDEIEQAQRQDPSDVTVFNNLAWIQAARGKTAEAEGIFRNAVQRAPQSPLAHFGLANFLAASGHMEEAEKHLRTAVTLDANYVAAHRALGWLMISTNRHAEAEAALSAAARLDTNVTSKLVLADFYVRGQKYSQAISLLEQVRSDPENYVVGTNRLAAASLAMGNRTRARTLIAELLKRMPKDPDARLLEARIAIEESDASTAVEVAEAVAKDYPQMAHAHYVLGQSLNAAGRGNGAVRAFSEAIRLNPRAISARLLLAHIYLQNGQVQSARTLANEVLRQQDGSVAARVLLVSAMRTERKFREAGEMLKILEKQAANVTAVHVEAAKLAVAQGNWAAATSALDRIEVLSGSSDEVIEGRIAVAIGMKRIEEAHQLVESRLREKPEDERLLLVAAETYQSSGSVAKAEKALISVLKNNPHQADALDRLARIYAQSGRLDDAERQLELMAANAENRVYALTVAAVLAQSQGKRELAKKRYEEVLSIDAAAPVPANNLAWLYLEDGTNLDLALQWAQTAKRAFPENPDFMDTLGVALTKKRLFDAAVAELRGAAVSAPDNALIQLHLAEALDGLGRKDEARSAAKRALQLDSTLASAADARRLAGESR